MVESMSLVEAAGESRAESRRVGRITSGSVGDEYTVCQLIRQLTQYYISLIYETKLCIISFNTFSPMLWLEASTSKNCRLLSVNSRSIMFTHYKELFNTPKIVD